MSSSHRTGEAVESLCEVLSHPKRRALLYALQGTETTTGEEVVRTLVETDGYRSDGGGLLEEANRVEVALHHVHLPKMEAAGVIDYDPEARTIETNGTTDTAYDLLDSISARKSD